jgi:hypothetical protein
VGPPIHSNRGHTGSAIGEASAILAGSKYRSPTDPKRGILHLCDIPMLPPESACIGPHPPLNRTVAVPSTIVVGPLASTAVILSVVRAVGASAPSSRPPPWRFTAVSTGFHTISNPFFNIHQILASPAIREFFQMRNWPCFGPYVARNTMIESES